MDSTPATADARTSARDNHRRDALDAAPDRCDVLVVGAGIAGATTAYLLARRGLHVLLVERNAFPRYKVCGSCLNMRSLRYLADLGLGGALRESGAVPLREILLGARHRSASVALPGGLALSRAKLDAMLVDRAQAAGSIFVDGTCASLGAVDSGYRQITLSRRGAVRTVRTRLVVAAGGLQGSLLDRAGEGRTHVAARSRIGVGTILDGVSGDFELGRIYMACGARGYTGMVRVEGGGLAVAAALDPSFARECGGAGAAVCAIIDESGLPMPELPDHVVWKGTPPLSRTASRLAAERVLVLGDAAGYVEPFTGEGMAWALESAQSAAGLLAGAVPRDWPAVVDAWPCIYRRQIRRRRLLCQGLSRLLRSPAATRLAIAILARTPALARPVMHRLNTRSRS